MKDRLSPPKDWPAPNEFMLELGRLTSLWGTLEATVNLAISKLAGYEKHIDPRALILIAHANFQQRLDMVSALCEHLGPIYPELARYATVVKAVEAAQKARNKYAHNAIVWDEERKHVTIAMASARGSLKTKVEVVHLNDLRETSAKIHEAMCAIHSLVTGQDVKPMWERDA